MLAVVPFHLWDFKWWQCQVLARLSWNCLDSLVSNDYFLFLISTPVSCVFTVFYIFSKERFCFLTQILYILSSSTSLGFNTIILHHCSFSNYVSESSIQKKSLSLFARWQGRGGRCNKLVTNGDKGGREGQKLPFWRWHTFWMAPYTRWMPGQCYLNNCWFKLLQQGRPVCSPCCTDGDVGPLPSNHFFRNSWECIQF